MFIKSLDEILDNNQAIMKKVMVTGADGFLGSNIVRELIKRQYQVIAFIEPSREAKTIKGLQHVTLKRGDILARKDVLEAMAGCNFVIHAAANTSVFPARSAHVREINIEGTKNVIAAAVQHRIHRLIHVGSANTFGFGSQENPSDETHPYACTRFQSDYMDSKMEAHYEVLKAVEVYNLPAIIACPTFMLGDFDTKPSSGAMIAAIYSENLPGYTKGGRNYIYVKDVATGIVNALSKGRIGEAYILGNVNLNYKEAFSLIASTIGVSPPKRLLPAWIARAYGLYGSIIHHFFNIKPAVDYSMAAIACEGFYYTSYKVIEELALPQTPIQTAILSSYECLKTNNLLPKNNRNVSIKKKLQSASG